jgi:hypothetical protein
VCGRALPLVVLKAVPSYLALSKRYNIFLILANTRQYLDKQLKVDEYINHVFSLEDVNKGFDAMHDPAGTTYVCHLTPTKVQLAFRNYPSMKGQIKTVHVVLEFFFVRGFRSWLMLYTT